MGNSSDVTNFLNKSIFSEAQSDLEKKQLDMKHREHTYSYFMRARILQFLDNEAHFTSLINYQAYKENAPEGQAHHMFLRFMNPQIYEFFSRKFICLVFLQRRSFLFREKDKVHNIDNN